MLNRLSIIILTTSKLTNNIDNFFTRSSSDVITAKTEYVYQALPNNGEARAVTLDISNAFD